MICPRCGKENEPENEFCGKCGLEFAQVVTEPSPAVTQRCHWHKNTETLLSCGRCERPVCTKCVVIGPAGVRCKECARHNVPVSARGIAHDVARKFSGLGRASPMMIYLWIFVAFSLFGVIRGCSMDSRRRLPDTAEPRIERPRPEEKSGN